MNTPTRTPTSPSTGGLTMRGADTSSLRRALDKGQVFFNASGVAQNPLLILKNVGVNYIRLRIWNNPASGYNNKAKVLQDALDVKAQGLKLMVDFHYSDKWADPGQQSKPAAWAGHTISQLQTDVYNYTFDVCNSLKAQGTPPDSVEIGNEITPGMLFEEGRINNNDFTNLSLLVKSGYNAIKDCNSATQVVLHIDRGGDNATARWWYDGMKAKGVNWDITGLSFYCYWHGTIPTMQSNVADLKARYGKPVILAETAYLFTTANGDSQGNANNATCSGYPATPAGQANNFRDVQAAAKAGGAIGVFYWEPTWVATPGNGWDPANINGTGSGWDNQAIFDFNFRLNPDIRWTP
jgi:arabinogalactan endo-1,4-beta-galactosidase